MINVKKIEIETRIIFEGGELPDIDTDIAGERRGEIKQYVEDIYGKNQVCSVGTYGTFQLAAGIKDLLRGKYPHEFINPIIKKVNFERGGSISYLFETSMKDKRLKKLLVENVTEINQLQTIHKGVKNESIHAAAVLIVPKEYGDVYSQIPIKREGGLLVSEWEGEDLANIGFLKEDLLGTNQLNKFSNIIHLVKYNRGVDIDFYNIPLDDSEVYHFYKRGLTSDNFHFGSNLLTSYLKKTQPNNIEDLIAIIALVRPGPLEAGSTNNYVLYKKNPELVTYLPGLEEITKDTFGLIVYQEQVMKICQVVGGFSLTEADGIRKAIGKIKISLLHSFKEKFIKNALEKGYEKEYLEELWTLMELHGRYSFNRSHSVAYAITGYICNWFKVNYPSEFWITAFQYAEKKKIPTYISELNRIEGSVVLQPVDINLSKTEFYLKKDSLDLYWSIDQVRMVGEVALKAFKDEKKESDFSSFLNFLIRIKENGRKINKAVIENLIFAGAFDKIENLPDSKSRILLMEKLSEEFSIKKEELFINKEVFPLKKNWWWILQQKRVSDFAYFDYEKIIIDEFPSLEKKVKSNYLDGFNILRGEKEGLRIFTAGIIVEIKEGDSKNGSYGRIILDSNFEEFQVTLWNEQWMKYKDIIENEKIIVLSGISTLYRGYYSLTVDRNSVIKILEDGNN